MDVWLCFLQHLPTTSQGQKSTCPITKQKTDRPMWEKGKTSAPLYCFQHFPVPQLMQDHREQYKTYMPENPSQGLTANQGCRRSASFQTSKENRGSHIIQGHNKHLGYSENVLFPWNVYPLYWTCFWGRFWNVSPNWTLVWWLIVLWVISKPILTLTIFCCASPRFSPSVQVVNGVQSSRHENGLSTKGDAAHFEEIIQLANHGNGTNEGREKSETSIPTEPILAFESEEPFMKKAGPIKPQHVAGK